MPLRLRVAISAVVIFSAMVYLFAWSSIFTVKNISISGLPSSISENSIITKAHLSLGEKLARIEPRGIEKKLEEMNWVKSASVNRNWINGHVDVALQSRIPVGIFRGQALDASGTLFDLPGKAPVDLPRVTAATPESGLDAIALFTSLPSDIRANTISINASQQSSISSWQSYSGGTLKVIWGSSQKIDLKVSVLRALLALEENKNVKRVDLSAPHAPIVK
jgi:cell division septal protein FtsQ